jgi:hypothetical protein
MDEVINVMYIVIYTMSNVTNPIWLHNHLHILHIITKLVMDLIIIHGVGIMYFLWSPLHIQHD